MTKENKKRLAITAVVLGILAVLTVLCIPYVHNAMQPDNIAKFQYWVEGLGHWGWIVLLLVEIVQIIIAIIPGEPVQIAAGAMYGPWIGFFICMVGIVIGVSFVFYAVRRFGTPLLNLFVSEKMWKKFSFLQDEKKLEVVTFILFLIPGTPKDVLTYIAGITPIKAKDFILLSTVARIPALLSSNFAGASLGQGQWQLTLIIFAVVMVIGGIGYWVNRHFMEHLKHTRLNRAIEEHKKHRQQAHPSKEP